MILLIKIIIILVLISILIYGIEDFLKWRQSLGNLDFMDDWNDEDQKNIKK